MPDKAAEWFSCRHIPQDHASIPRAREHETAIGAERSTNNSLTMTCESPDFCPVCEIPQAHVEIQRPREGAAPVGAERNTLYTCAVPGEEADRRASRNLP